MQFSTSLEEILDMYKKKEKSYTENGALAFSNAKRYINTFNFNITNYRHEDWNRIGEEFSKVFYEEGPIIACKYFFYIMDIREALGERNITKGIMRWLLDNHPEILEKIYEFIPEYNRWDTLILLADPQFNNNEELRQKVLKTIENQLVQDLRNIGTNNSISLLGKWMPSENASSQKTRKLARQLQKDLRVSPKNYRCGLAMLRKQLNVVECDMSKNNWNKINYEHVPSKANLNYSDAFMRHDEERRREYLDSLRKGETKINAKVLAPYEIVEKYTNAYYGVKQYDEALEQMWKALPQYQMNDVLVIRDGSGSMTAKCTSNTSCLDVATSLAIYAAEHNSKAWKDKFITFSSSPKFVNMSNCSSLREKISLCNRYGDCSNTDIFSTMKLILDVALRNRYKQSQMPKTILIVSDMQFDSNINHSYYRAYGTSKYSSPFNYDKTLFQEIQNMYAMVGYKLPRIVFWNVDSRGNKTVPIQENELGMTLVSGFTANIFKMVLSEELDPYKQLLSVLNSSRYSFIDEVLDK